MGARYYVYRNLHKKCWSLKQHGRVIGHYDSMMFDGHTHPAIDYFGFSVNEGGRQRVIREKRKNVHAYCWGWYPTLDSEAVNIRLLMEQNLVKVTYNPYENGFFKDALTGTQINCGSAVFFTPKGLYVANPR